MTRPALRPSNTDIMLLKLYNDTRSIVERSNSLAQWEQGTKSKSKKSTILYGDKGVYKDTNGARI